MPIGDDGQAHVHHLQPQATRLRHIDAAAVARPALTPRHGAGLHQLGLALQSWHARKCWGAKRGVHARDNAHVGITPFQPQQLTVIAQQQSRVLQPRQRAAIDKLQGLQTLHVAGEAGANVVDRIGRIALDARLQLRHFIASRQPHQGAEHGQHQRNQSAPQDPTSWQGPARHGSTFTTRGCDQEPSTWNSVVLALIKGLVSTDWAK